MKDNINNKNVYRKNKTGNITRFILPAGSLKHCVVDPFPVLTCHTLSFGFVQDRRNKADVRLLPLNESNEYKIVSREGEKSKFGVMTNNEGCVVRFNRWPVI